MTFARIAAQDTAVATLEAALAGARLAQSYLFVGPSGVGKTTTALALARAALCPKAPGVGCDACEVCSRIDAGNHPDVRVLWPRDEGDRNLPVEFVRSEVLPFAKFAPFEGPRAFIVFPQADVSFPVNHAEAANALLKTLEEPRPLVHFVLTSERPDRLLTTIRSRCQRVRFGPLPRAAVERVLADHDVPEDVRAAAVALAGGRADVALALAAEGRAAATLDVAVRIDEAVASAATGPLLDLAEELAKSDDRPMVLECLALLYRDVAAAGLGLPSERLVLAHRAELVQERARLITPAVAAARVQRIEQLAEDFGRNANPEVALDGLLLSL